MYEKSNKNKIMKINDVLQNDHKSAGSKPFASAIYAFPF